jgi:hypothetical protein
MKGNKYSPQVHTKTMQFHPLPPKQDDHIFNQISQITRQYAQEKRTSLTLLAVQKNRNQT